MVVGITSLKQAATDRVHITTGPIVEQIERYERALEQISSPESISSPKSVGPPQVAPASSIVLENRPGLEPSHQQPSADPALLSEMIRMGIEATSASLSVPDADRPVLVCVQEASARSSLESNHNDITAALEDCFQAQRTIEQAQFSSPIADPFPQVAIVEMLDPKDEIRMALGERKQLEQHEQHERQQQQQQEQHGQHAQQNQQAHAWTDAGDLGPSLTISSLDHVTSGVQATSVPGKRRRNPPRRSATSKASSLQDGGLDGTGSTRRRGAVAREEALCEAQPARPRKRTPRRRRRGNDSVPSLETACALLEAVYISLFSCPLFVPRISSRKRSDRYPREPATSA